MRLYLSDSEAGKIIEALMNSGNDDMSVRIIGRIEQCRHLQVTQQHNHKNPT